jgi:type IV pilus assembly protein PilP
MNPALHAIARRSARGLALAAAVLASCTQAPPPRRAAPPPAAPKPVVEEAAQAAPTTMYVYSPIGKRDPFLNTLGNKDQVAVRVEGRKPTPLQRWGLDQLRLSMTVTGTASPMAMLEDPENRGWPVRIGDFVGKNWGKVTSIQRDQIVVTETITDHSTGRVYPQSIKLVVPESKQEEIDLRALKEGSELIPTAQRER